MNIDTQVLQLKILVGAVKMRERLRHAALSDVWADTGHASNQTQALIRLVPKFNTIGSVR